MFFGFQPAVVLQIRPLSIHGEALYDVFFQVDGEGHARSARLGSEVLPAGLKAGDRIQAKFVMDTVTKIQRETPA